MVCSALSKSASVRNAGAGDAGVLLRRTAANLPRVHVLPSVGASPSFSLPRSDLIFIIARRLALRESRACAAESGLTEWRAGLNVYSILQKRTLVLTAAAAAEVTERLTRPIKR